MKYQIDKNYYTSRKEELLKQYDEAVRSWSTFVFSKYGEINAWRILTDAKKAFEELIPKIPYIGGDENRRTGTLLESVRFLAFYQGMKKHDKTAEEAGKILFDAFCAKAAKVKKNALPEGWKERKKYLALRKKAADESQERRYLAGHVLKFVPADGNTFDYGYDFTECASQKFFHEQGADEFMPFRCYLDFPLCSSSGLGLTRTKTLAEGDEICNHRFSPGKETKLVWPPPFLNKEEKLAPRPRKKAAPKKAIMAFAGYLTATRYEDLPAAVVASAKQEILDSLATALGGSGKAGVPELVDMVKEWGGAKQSTVIGYGLKVPAPNAAQVNGTMIHALDYDDGHQVALVHIGCTAVSTAFAAAERVAALKGNVSGKELITALALGADFESRMSLASKPGGSIISTGWHPTVLFGFLSTAAIAGRIFGLNEDKMINALGLAYHQAGGAGSGVPDGALAKRMGPGLAAKVGITSALMAERGITGDRDPLEGKTGLYQMYMAGDYDPKVLTKELGKRWEGVNIGDKPYPCCGFTHAAVDGILSLRTKHKISPENIKEVTVVASQSTYDLSQPPEVKRNPRTIIDAQFSVPYVAAVVLLYGAVTVDDFTLETIKRPAVLKMAQKVNTILNTSMNRHGVGPSTVTIMMKDGKSYTEHVEFCLGSVERPMTLDDIARKFRECAKSAVKPLKKDAVEKIIDMVGRLETLDDAAEIIRMVG
jgi:2-methylcitrate dehydratase PrpD